ncbi:TerB family tellurite resistance protein [Zhouia sp. PK063]|uniref:TerB family tellurite resistance protein n=1 Tax=Zhouia sp. PK063 TaxID=3373602 RepID=UPI0037AA5F77
MKWLLAIVGFTLYGGRGAIVGLVIGFLIEQLYPSSSASFGSGSTKSRSASGGRSINSVSPSDFELNLLSLCAIVIKADGQVSQRELDYVRQYFVATYGKEKANAIFRTFNDVIKKREVSAERVARYLAGKTRYEVRLQLLHFLFSIAQADGNVSNAEVNQIQQIAYYLGVNQANFDSIKAMFFKSAENAYKILEIDKSATNDEVKKAYRNMAKKHHPDKVQHLGEAYVKGAQEKFQQIQDAYEQIQKERGF